MHSAWDTAAAQQNCLHWVQGGNGWKDSCKREVLPGSASQAGGWAGECASSWGWGLSGLAGMQHRPGMLSLAGRGRNGPPFAHTQEEAFGSPIITHHVPCGGLRVSPAGGSPAGSLQTRPEGGACQATQVSWFCHLFLTLAAPRHSTSFPEMDL